jgi:hypothetical protein
MYGVYHLLRPAKGRTPTNSGSYHFFTLFMDTAIIPFYVFVVLLANQNYNEDVGTPDRWTSLFTNQHTTDLLIWVTYVGGIVLSALHFLSIGLDLYLVIMFRRIASLPPDMNPLEDNLTRRASKKHKHKNSEMSSSSSETLAEKKLGYYSGGSFVSDDWSRPGTKSAMSARTMPFGQSRVDSNQNFSPHNPDSARLSRQQFDNKPMRPDSNGGRSSRQESPTRQTRPPPRGPTKQASFYENMDDEPVHPDHLDSFLANGVINHEHFVHPSLQKTPTPQRQASPEQQKGLLSDNWYVLDNESEVDMGSPQRQRGLSPAAAYSKIPIRDRHDSFDPQPTFDSQPAVDPQPLGMNPPTPVNGPGSDGKTTPTPDHRPERLDQHQHQHHHPQQPHHHNNSKYSPAAQHPLDDDQDDRTLTMQSDRSTIQASSIYSDDAPTIRMSRMISPGVPKGKYYGDLAAATIGVRGGAGIGTNLASSSAHKTLTNKKQRHHHNTNNNNNINNNNNSRSVVPAVQPPPSSTNGSPRVISRTGVDITDAHHHHHHHLSASNAGMMSDSMSYDSDHPSLQMYGIPRRREVSGKVAEEGRGGGGSGWGGRSR